MGVGYSATVIFLGVGELARLTSGIELPRFLANYQKNSGSTLVNEQVQVLLCDTHEHDCRLLKKGKTCLQQYDLLAYEPNLWVLVHV